MSEQIEAKRDSAKLQPNSGRGKHAKGDAVLEDTFRIDYKEYKKSFGLTPEIWGKCCTDAYKAGGYEPALKLVMGDPKVRLFVISETMFHEMLAAYLGVNRGA